MHESSRDIESDFNLFQFNLFQFEYKKMLNIDDTWKHLDYR